MKIIPNTSMRATRMLAVGALAGAALVGAVPAASASAPASGPLGICTEASPCHGGGQDKTFCEESRIEKLNQGYWVGPCTWETIGWPAWWFRYYE
jgi:hypothetical protein